jgi:hypothetical protein
MAKFLTLENVEQTAKEHPDTFFLPSEKERKSQKIGASVRLHFLLKNPSENDPTAERMWVKVTQECGFLKPYKGILESPPVLIDDLKPGDQVTFKPCHIAQTIIKKGDPQWIDSGDLKALVSEMCFEQNEIVRFLYREKPDEKEDSGWRMFTGHEPPSYTDDPNNTRVVVVGLMLDRDPSLLEPLKASAGAAFEREDKRSPWRQVTDWKAEE